MSDENTIRQSAEDEYDAAKFKKLSDREHVRVRYGMYIGDSSVAGR